MNKAFKYLANILFLLVLILGNVFAQPKQSKVVYTYSTDETVIQLDRSLKASELDSISRQFALKELELPYLFEQGKLHPDAVAQGWKMQSADKNHFELHKTHETSTLGNDPTPASLLDWENRILLTDHFVKNDFNTYHHYPTAIYGLNEYKKNEGPINVGGRVRFTLKDHLNASEVLISGSFNGWSTGSGKMQRSIDGWEIDLALEPGKYLYKFIVDGQWINDPHNLQKENDGFRGFNSVYFHYNKRFIFDALPKARKVYLTASFNDWDTKSLPMKLQNKQWVLDMYLAEGTYAYKYKADNRWYLDPDNSVSLFDDEGIENSYTSVGDTLYFKLGGYLDAKKVILTGNFNNWNERELQMQKTSNGWELPYVLAPGAYEYKYIVDGQWLVDPASTYVTGSGDFTNGLRIVKPNIRIRLNGFEKANEVILAGSFNFWDEYSLKMQKDENGWYIDYYLAPGKHTYKFKVDGEWLRDPQNKLWEDNEFGTGNSVIWMHPNNKILAP